MQKMSQCFCFINRVFFLVLMFGIMSNAYSQTEFNGRFKAVPPKNKDLDIDRPTISKEDLAKINSYVPEKIPENNFVVPKNEEIDPEKSAKRNQNLGVFKTNSGIAKVRYRDAAYVDGDRIRVYLNYVIVQPEVVLDGEFKGFDIKLNEEGVNRIEFEALNEGYASPNTAQFQIFDDKGNIICENKWNIAEGYKATLILEK